MIPRHPVQPLVTDQDGVVRFKPNAIVEFLLDAGPFDMNKLASMRFPKEDYEQFAQLIGYSLSGFGDLSYVSDETYEMAKVRGGGMSKTYSYCEPVFAGSFGRWCIRPLTDAGPKYGGGVDTSSLCGRVSLKLGGWDIRVPFGSVKKSVVCIRCLEIFKTKVDKE